MGADLYRAGYDARKAELTAVDKDPWGPDNDQYFRDSYNDSSLLWQLGLSWWSDVAPIIDAGSTDAEGFSDPDTVKAVVDLVASRSLPESLVGEDREYFEAKRKRLLGFLGTAVANREHVLFSI